MTGTFITVEGIDGAGKTLAVQAIKNKFNIITTREPSNHWTGKYVREALQQETPPFTDFFLLMADRHYHIEEHIKPALENGDNVVSDRFADSTFTYQQVQLQDQQINVHSWIEYVMFPWIITPDLTIYLDVSIDTALERADRDEKYENREMLKQVKENYIKLSASNKDRYVIIDAEQSKSTVREEVLQIVGNHL